MVIELSGEDLRERDHLENLGTDGRLHHNGAYMSREVAERIYLAQGRVRWRAFVSAVMSLRVP
jgi:hypothetical protein